MTETISIIGAGIGGLATALILKRKGLDVKIFESSAAIKPIGAGIIIANNAMQVFKMVDIQEKVEKAGNRISYMKITDPLLKPISIADLTGYEKKYGVHNVALHRSELQNILANEVGHENINLSKRLIKAVKLETFNLTFEDNSTVKTKVLIGADGIRSVVRNQLFDKSTLRNANQICWRGVCECDLPQKYHAELNEAWGKGKRFGFVKISERKVYWYALVSSKNTILNDLSLEDIFKEFHPDILAIIKSTNPDELFVSEIVDLKPIDKWQDENVCLVGDAAHATTPNLGQGACQAIEDAYVLGKLSSKDIVLGNIFKDYERLRRTKAHAVVNTSWLVGKMAHVESDLGIWFRNLVMRTMPKSANKRQMDMIFTLD